MTSGPQVGHAPRDALVVPDDDTRHAREGEARHPEGAGLRDLPALEVDLRPDAGDREGEVRVVGEQRLARRRARARDDPRVRADVVAATERRGGRVEGGDRRVDRAARRRCCAGPRARSVRRTPPGRWPRPWPSRAPSRRPRGSAGCGRRGRAGRAARSACSEHTAAREPGTGQLVVVVAAQVPGDRLEPGEGVDGRPRLDAVARVAALEDGVLERHLLGRLDLTRCRR